MDLVIYDGSFEGLLTAFFEIYEYKINDPVIHKAEDGINNLFGTTHNVITGKDKSERVYKKLHEKLSRKSLKQVYKTFLSGEKNIENVLFRFIQYVMSSKGTVENDYSHPDVLLVQQVSRKVDREKHRMEAFIRFQLTKDQLYYSVIQPDYNVLPLISKHFEERYADQRWFIYDITRKYGLYYDLQKVEEVEMNFTIDVHDPSNVQMHLDEKEELYQRLWQQYFSSINIIARKNMKLHIQHMPKRYWKYLVEKKL